MSDVAANASSAPPPGDADDERDTLVAWFVRRYPTAEARLDYAIRKRRAWREVQRRGPGYAPDRDGG